ncbi:hypothetical protein MPSEU_000664900 [Mayamaea pseudoterrestris]|nr:hypothetical protein MPSEU_000664900 [Mayamaea pseudoterrestris]
MTRLNPLSIRDIFGAETESRASCQADTAKTRGAARVGSAIIRTPRLTFDWIRLLPAVVDHTLFSTLSLITTLYFCNMVQTRRAAAGLPAPSPLKKAAPKKAAAAPKAKKAAAAPAKEKAAAAPKAAKAAKGKKTKEAAAAAPAEQEEVAAAPPAPADADAGEAETKEE